MTASIPRLLFFTDAHFCPTDTEEDLQRASALGLFALNQRADRIVNGGDWWHLRSLNPHFGGTLMGGDGGDEGHSLYQDIVVGRDAFKAFYRPILQFNRKHELARHRERMFIPKLDFCAGNHEDFMRRLGLKYPALKEMLSLDDLRDIVVKFGWDWHDFNRRVIIGGVCFRHFVPAKNPRQALAIDRHLGITCMSSAVGHTHGYAVRTTNSADGRLVTALVGPSSKPIRKLAEHEQSGAILMKNVSDGQFSHEFVPMAELLQEYRDYLMARGTAQEAA